MNTQTIKTAYMPNGSKIVTITSDTIWKKWYYTPLGHLFKREESTGCWQTFELCPDGQVRTSTSSDGTFVSNTYTVHGDCKTHTVNGFKTTYKYRDDGSLLTARTPKMCYPKYFKKIKETS